MAATPVYLIRSNNLTWAKYDSVIDVFLSGSQTAYASVTGVAATNIITITGATLADGMLITLTSLAGGTGLSTGVGYYAVSSSGSTCKLALTQGGSEIDFTTNITAGSVIVSIEEMRVWSTEFRDQFDDGSQMYAAPSSVTPAPDNYIPATFTGAAALIPNSPFTLQQNSATTDPPADVYAAYTTGITASISDEKNHYPLRQTLLNRTFWLFDRGASATPRYLPAEYQEGDIIATSPPQTP